MRQRKVSDLQRLSPLKSRTPVCRDTPHEGLYTGPTPMAGPQAAPSSSIDIWARTLGDIGNYQAHICNWKQVNLMALIKKT